MKKLIAMAVAVILVLGGSTLASAHSTHKGAPHVSGTITAWDDATKQVTVKDSTGKEHSLTWNDQTKVEGAPKVGEHASVTYTKEKDGKMMATHIHVGEKTASTKPATK
jgi:cobalamin-dependent methionine synthase I